MALDVLGYDIPHSQPEGGDVVAIEYLAIAFLDTAIKAFRNRMLHVQFAAWE